MTDQNNISVALKYEENILDLDILKKSILKEQNTITINAIYTLVEMIKTYSISLGVSRKYIDSINQYYLKIKYLNNILPVVFEYDNSFQYLNIIYYNNDNSKYYLKISINISDGAIIKYIENDHSGLVPSYHDEKITLKPGEYLVNFSHCLLSFIGISHCTLEDDSYLIGKNIAGLESRTKLWLLYLITKGKSWYAKFGYSPKNCSLFEYQNAISDVCNIQLSEIFKCLTSLLNMSSKHLFDKNLIDISEKIILLINDSTETMYQYTINHSLEEFTNLTNYLSQSIYGRKIHQSDNVSNNVKLDYQPNHDMDIVFTWFEKYEKLRACNAIQINNNINYANIS